MKLREEQQKTSTNRTKTIEENHKQKAPSKPRQQTRDLHVHLILVRLLSSVLKLELLID